MNETYEFDAHTDDAEEMTDDTLDTVAGGGDWVWRPAEIRGERA